MNRFSTNNNFIFLSAERQILYRSLAERYRLPLHFQPWWLDAVCGNDKWGAAVVQDGDGGLCGLMPYFLKTRMGIKVLGMPPFTDYLGVWMRYPELPQKPERRYAYEHKVMTQLIDQLPAFHFANIQLYPEVESWLPFYWNGYKQTTLYTYRLEDLSDPGNLLAGAKGSVRTDLKKAEGKVRVEESNDTEAFYDLHALSFQKQGLPLPYSKNQLLNLDQAARKRHRNRLFLAFVEGRTEPVAGLYTVWDDKTAYFLMHGADPVFYPAGAATALYWHAILAFCATHEQIDFCGSMLAPVESFTRAFGGVRRPHHRIYKAASKGLYLLSLLTGREY